MKDVFLAMVLIVEKHIVERGAKEIVVKNSTDRRVTITRASDLDVSAVEEIGQQVHRKIAIEVKGGLDFSNVNKRAGEAEKLHLKAKAKQYKDFSTIISKKHMLMQKLRAESQTTTEWFDLSELLARQGTDWEDCRAKLPGAVGIPLSDTPMLNGASDRVGGSLMRAGRPLAPLSISEQDRAQLVGWTKRPQTAQALAMRSRIVLLAAQGGSNKVIAARLHTIPHTVGKWRRRYLKIGLDG